MQNIDFKHNRHSCYSLKYHLVVVTKYCRPVINNNVSNTIKNVITDIIETRSGGKVIRLNFEPDHIHVFFETPPQVQLSILVNSIKTVSSRLIRKQHSAHIAQFYWEPVFWSDNYFIGSVGDVTTAIVEAYVKSQRREN